VLDEYDDRVLIGEIYLPLERLIAYYGEDLSGAHLPFNFQLLYTSWNAHELATLIGEYEQALPEGGWPNWVLGNHDQPRIAARVGKEQARVAGMLLLTLRGTPTLYYGDEIGLGKVEIPPELMQDPWEKNEPGLGLGRDPQRTPMQWDGSGQAGFTRGAPWLPLSPEAHMCNVDALRTDSRSILSLYRQVIALRRAYPALAVGRYRPIAAEGNLLVYGRSHADQQLVIALNLGSGQEAFRLRGGIDRLRVLLSTYLDREEVVAALRLRPNEGVVGLVDGDA
jgi:alpha-glucosidase